MAVLAFDLGTLSADGTGTAVATTFAGRTKTIIVSGTFVASVHVEVSCGGLMFFPIKSFNGPEIKPLIFAASSMRFRVEDHVSGTISVTVVSEDSGGLFTALQVPSSDGVGTAVDISAYGDLKTVIFGVDGNGQNPGSHEIEFSADNVHWGQLFKSFTSPGLQTLEAPAFYARVRREGLDPRFVGTTAVFLGAVEDGGGGGSSGNLQVFHYTHAGADSSDFIVTLPAARADADYGVEVTSGGVTNEVTFDVPVADQTTTQFRVITSGNITSGDVITFFVADVQS
jgi:hypothetical protein